jgi:hypothetical protein
MSHSAAERGFAELASNGRLGFLFQRIVGLANRHTGHRRCDASLLPLLNVNAFVGQRFQ